MKGTSPSRGCGGSREWASTCHDEVANVHQHQREGKSLSFSTGLLADESQLFHQTTDLETANCRTFLAHHAHIAAAAGRAATFDEQLVHTRHALGIHMPGALPVRIQAGPRHTQCSADQLDRFVFANLIDYFVPSIPSEIKGAVAFLKMAFSRSRRSMRASSSLMRC